MPAPHDALIGTKLDRKRPYSTVYGETRFKYEQDGLHFDGSETYVGRTPGWKPAAQSMIPSAGGIYAVKMKLKDLNLLLDGRDLSNCDLRRLGDEYRRLTGLEWRGKREGLLKAIRSIYRRVVAAVSRQIPEATITDWNPNPTMEGSGPPRDPEDEEETDPPENPDGEGHDGDAPPAVELKAAPVDRLGGARVGRLPSRDLDTIADAAAAARDRMQPIQTPGAEGFGTAEDAF